MQGIILETETGVLFVMWQRRSQVGRKPKRQTNEWWPRGLLCYSQVVARLLYVITLYGLHCWISVLLEYNLQLCNLVMLHFYLKNLVRPPIWKKHSFKLKQLRKFLRSKLYLFTECHFMFCYFVMHGCIYLVQVQSITTFVTCILETNLLEPLITISIKIHTVNMMMMATAIQ